MSEIIQEISVICQDCMRIKNSILKNNIIFKATKEQETQFYKMVDSIINRLEFYMKRYENTNHVTATEFYMMKLDESNESERVSYEFPRMRDNLNYYYKEFIDIYDEDTNFVAATMPSILFPLRLIAEKLYLELTGNKFDETLYPER